MDQTKATQTARRVTATKAASTVAEPAPEYVIYASARPEIERFAIHLDSKTRIPSRYDAAREHLIFKVPAELVERLERHHHFISGRIIRAQ